jgi:hypothetical protein
MEYQGRPIVKQVINIGTGGEVELPPELVGAEPRSRVTVSMELVLGADKHKFEKDGTITYSRILTIDAETFEVTGILAPPPVPEHPTLDEAEAAPVVHEITRSTVDDAEDGRLYIAVCSCGEEDEGFDEAAVDAWQRGHLAEVEA